MNCVDVNNDVFYFRRWPQYFIRTKSNWRAQVKFTLVTERKEKYDVTAWVKATAEPIP